MPQQRFSKLRSVIVAAITAVTALLGAVSSVLADTGSGPYP
jgi:zinc transporter ZupT